MITFPSLLAFSLTFTCHTEGKLHPLQLLRLEFQTFQLLFLIVHHLLLQPPLKNIKHTPKQTLLNKYKPSLQLHESSLSTIMAVLSSSSAATRSAAERISWYCSLFLAMLLVFACCDDFDESESNMWYHQKMQGHHCDEIYVVEEGETLHTISEKCGDPFIVEENPHIQDPDDVFPGLVIKITPNNIR